MSNKRITFREFQRFEDIGRIRLSKHFFLREFLFSEIAALYGLRNFPDNIDLALKAGERLCVELLEPLQDRFGRVVIRSGYRSCEVNELGNRYGHGCARNSANYAAHIWDRLDAKGHMGATACVVLPEFWDDYNSSGEWRVLAEWIDENLPYSRLCFFPKMFAFNIQWHETPKRKIQSYAAPRRVF